MNISITAEFIIHRNVASCLPGREERAFQGDLLHCVAKCLFHLLLNQLQRAVNRAHSLKRSVWTSLFNKREREYRQVDSGNFASTLKDTRAQ